MDPVQETLVTLRSAISDARSDLRSNGTLRWAITGGLLLAGLAAVGTASRDGKGDAALTATLCFLCFLSAASLAAVNALFEIFVIQRQCAIMLMGRRVNAILGESVFEDERFWRFGQDYLPGGLYKRGVVAWLWIASVLLQGAPLLAGLASLHLPRWLCYATASIVSAVSSSVVLSFYLRAEGRARRLLREH